MRCVGNLIGIYDEDWLHLPSLGLVPQIFPQRPTMSSSFVTWLRSPAAREYFFSTHFWGPVANWGLPLAAIADLKKDETMISWSMTPTLFMYSCVFMRFALRVQPRNMLLFACHLTNATAQGVQVLRLLRYQYNLRNADKAQA